MPFPEKGEDDRPYALSDTQNAVIASVIYMFGAVAMKRHIPEVRDRLQELYNLQVETDTFEYVLIPILMGLTSGLAITSVSKPDAPYLTRALPGLFVSIASLVTAANMLSSLSLDPGNMLSAMWAYGGFRAGREARYRFVDRGW